MNEKLREMLKKHQAEANELTKIRVETKQTMSQQLQNLLGRKAELDREIRVGEDAKKELEKVEYDIRETMIKFLQII